MVLTKKRFSRFRIDFMGSARCAEFADTSSSYDASYLEINHDDHEGQAIKHLIYKRCGSDKFKNEPQEQYDHEYIHIITEEVFHILHWNGEFFLKF